MSMEKVIAIMEKYANGVKGGVFIPFLSKDSDVIMAYCLSVKEVTRDCPDCVLKQRYGKGVRCPIVVRLVV